MALDSFLFRHNGPRSEDIDVMLKIIGVGSLEELIDKTVPESIRLNKPMNLPNDGVSEHEYLLRIWEIMSKNKIYRSYIGLGYYNTIFPAVIQRNILENPSWYTSYTPYQAEISQGRLEALLNFQTVVMDLTGMEIANASLLDESTAAAEAMIMMFNSRSREKMKSGAVKFFVDENMFPQNIAVLETRAVPLGIELVKGSYLEIEPDDEFFGLMVQYPAGDGKILDYRDFVSKAAGKGVYIGVIADILSLSLLIPPGEWGADVVVGSTQRFGIPLGYGGPHAGYFATLEKFKRYIPGRIIGVTVDVQGNHALRMALQTREQHIKRERATSNICTAQALLATMAGMYATYHGADGLIRIARHVHQSAGTLAVQLDKLGFVQQNNDYFDTLKVALPEGISQGDIERIALDNQINFYYAGDGTIGISLDEATLIKDINHIIAVFAKAVDEEPPVIGGLDDKLFFDKKYIRKSSFLTLDVFNSYRSETEMMRYIKKLERKDFSLTHSMISLGSCTMKLNAASQMLPLSWPEVGGIHPFVPVGQAEGYHELMDELAADLCEITGFDAISFQPNSGAAGEYTGLMVIRGYHESRNEGHRNICLIPSSAHGTNPASAVMAGMNVVIIECDKHGNVDLKDLRSKAELHRDNLAAFMVTYPSTHGVYEPGIKEMTSMIHENGGLVYMDGANMNAQVGLTNPAIVGADVCHLNLHKTFAIPHGGGGPGMGPIGVAAHLVEFLPKHPVITTGGEKGAEAVAAAPWGSASILTISHAYIKMLGGRGLTEATRVAILNANYLAACLRERYDILYKGMNGFVAHEMILDCRKFRINKDIEITEADIAKRLMDYGFHAPTLSFPVAGTLMVEPTESESLHELNRFIEAMISIHEEIMEISKGEADKKNNVLKNAPHTSVVTVSDKWDRPYGREKAAYPLKWVSDNKFWPAVSRVDDAHGDRNLMCSCAPLDSYRSGLFEFKDLK
jgi:glycine dehydrogenase